MTQMPFSIDNLDPSQIVNAVFAVAGAAIVIYGVYTKFAIKAAAKWPFVEGVVTLSAIETDTTYSDGRERRTEKHVFMYEFIVDGIAYAGDRIRHGFSPGSPRDLFRIYHPNKLVRVYYNPQNPSSCCLEIARPVVANILIFSGLVVGCIGPFINIQ